jgi:hypothetical protein
MKSATHTLRWNPAFGPTPATASLIIAIVFVAMAPYWLNTTAGLEEFVASVGPYLKQLSNFLVFVIFLIVLGAGLSLVLGRKLHERTWTERAPESLLREMTIALGAQGYTPRKVDDGLYVFEAATLAHTLRNVTLLVKGNEATVLCPQLALRDIEALVSQRVGA